MTLLGESRTIGSSPACPCPHTLTTCLPVRSRTHMTQEVPYVVHKAELPRTKQLGINGGFERRFGQLIHSVAVLAGPVCAILRYATTPQACEGEPRGIGDEGRRCSPETQPR